jgi:hypothetical protein
VEGAAREDLNVLDRKFEKSEDDLKAIQNVGQIIGEVLKQLDEDRCACPSCVFCDQWFNARPHSI